jgi:hypothetical protein
VLTKWVRDGLPWAAGEDAAPAAAPSHAPAGGPDKNYWAYQPVKRPAVPEVKDKTWVATPVDAFVLAKQEAKGLKPVGPADKAALCRRAYYDLLGLPPTPEQVDAFVADPSPAAFERLVDELLASPQYGEKWGRHWLDVVRFAETNGYERDGPKPNAWRYRDYVIQSFNADKPFDRFVKEQIAGDELWPDDPAAVVATGFYRLGTWDDEPADPQQALYDGYDDWSRWPARGSWAMTQNCNRCHDHKGDFFPQADYYKLLAFFRDVRPYSETRDVRSSNSLADVTPWERRKGYEPELKARRARAGELTRLMTAVEDEAIKAMPAEDQRASEGPDRPQVVKKVPEFLDEKKRTEYYRLRRELTETRKKPLRTRSWPGGGQLRPPAAADARPDPRQPGSPGQAGVARVPERVRAARPGHPDARPRGPRRAAGGRSWPTGWRPRRTR